jgi:hypothetical protein
VFTCWHERAARVGFESRQGQEIFLFSVESRLALWSTQPLVQWVSGAVPPRIKRRGHEADQAPPRSCRAVPSLPHISSCTMLNCVLKHRSNFTFNTKMHCRSASFGFTCISHVSASETCCMTFKLFWICFPRNPNLMMTRFVFVTSITLCFCS